MSIPNGMRHSCSTMNRTISGTSTADDLWWSRYTHLLHEGCIDLHSSTKGPNVKNVGENQKSLPQANLPSSINRAPKTFLYQHLHIPTLIATNLIIRCSIFKRGEIRNPRKDGIKVAPSIIQPIRNINEFLERTNKKKRQDFILQVEAEWNYRENAVSVALHCYTSAVNIPQTPAGATICTQRLPSWGKFAFTPV
ncbi:uncharacterized protein BDR25DRAFT_351446 [Lindgomyces ingoldianus]|uniref:Uncharacterized protein n=1 Tax=Lindgomyces ingoldianus TaxID=673940 RepID=A0ACB6R6N9_9PLEO|nr:uncharacterized protein BDR25DRAFT_351446 [Lindgomyces ingoldianus]KAF2474963.1 hypothetical protein BDR25DRAFT_351446 [Lindgomyces ingoldianus]